MALSEKLYTFCVFLQEVMDHISDSVLYKILSAAYTVISSENASSKREWKNKNDECTNEVLVLYQILLKMKKK